LRRFQARLAPLRASKEDSPQGKGDDKKGDSKDKEEELPEEVMMIDQGPRP
jgi:hypothetical protein